MRVVEAALFMWVIFAHPTQEGARLHDSMGQSTSLTWR